VCVCVLPTQDGNHHPSSAMQSTSHEQPGLAPGGEKETRSPMRTRSYIYPPGSVLPWTQGPLSSSQVSQPTSTTAQPAGLDSPPRTQGFENKQPVHSFLLSPLPLPLDSE
jgi:hypothetical protein